jgi:hypothetical protein
LEDKGFEYKELETAARSQPCRGATIQGRNRPRNIVVGRGPDTFLRVSAPPGHFVGPHNAPAISRKYSNITVERKFTQSLYAACLELAHHFATFNRR